MKGTITGKLLIEIRGKGSRSEGPVCWILPSGEYKDRWDQIIVRKRGLLWQEDSNLHNLVNKEVEILADIIETRTSITIDYFEVKEKKGE